MWFIRDPGADNRRREEGVDHVQMLRTAYGIWLGREKASKIDTQASKVFQGMMAEIEAAEKSCHPSNRAPSRINGEDGSDDSLQAIQHQSGSVAQVSYHFQFDLTPNQNSLQEDSEGQAEDWVRCITLRLSNTG